MKNYNDHNLVTFSNSLLKHYHVAQFHQTEQAIDTALGDHKKVVVMSFDGMGQNIVPKHLKYNSFLRQHILCTINSTFPPTTTAATTAFLTGKYPIETGWMAWAQYFDKYQKNIILFKNLDYNTETKAEPENIANTELPIKSIFELIKEKNKDVHVFDVKRWPIDADGPKSLRDFERRINKSIRHKDKCLGYFYFDSPDREMHVRGINSFAVHRYVKRINNMIKRLMIKNPDTLFLTFADHGHINVKYLDICEHQDLYELLNKPLSFEKRTPTFFIKEGKNKEFETLFNEYYGKHFELMSKEEALQLQMFGEGVVNFKALQFIGDYVATSKDEYCLYASKEMARMDFFKGHHAGNTSEEMTIDVFACNV